MSATTNRIIMGITALILGCSTTQPQRSEEPRFKEAYDVYPAVTGSGVSRHLVRSHTTAILVRPGTSVLELCSRSADQVWDLIRRIETRFIRFPALGKLDAPEAAMGFGCMDMEEWERYLERLTGNPATTAEVEFIIGGERFYSELLDSIDDATSNIDIQTYLFDNDDVARHVADQLRTKSREADVRIIFDGLGTYLSHTAYAPSQPEGTEFIENMPAYLLSGSNIRLRVIPNTWFSGNHVKSIIFDRRKAYIGGMNIGREYQHDWHDMMIRLEGDAVGLLTKDFNRTWRHSGWGGDFALLFPESPEPEMHGITNGSPVRFLYTLPTSAQIYRAQLEAIRRCRSYIYIENCYFADDRILYELCKASRRGVDVRVILPKTVNHKIMEHSNRVAINTLLEHGANVYLYPRMSHVKAAVYDGWACVGTANFDKLSLQVIREVNLATSDPKTVNNLIEQLFEPDFEQSILITEPIPVDLSDHLIELIADET